MAITVRAFSRVGWQLVLTAGVVAISSAAPGQEIRQSLVPTPAPGAAPAAAPAKPGAPAAKAAKGEKSAPTEEKERKPEKLDIKSFGRPEGKELNVSSRYYLWHDGDGWHIRSCCKDGYYATFQGEIEVKGGTFEKLRTIELEAKGKHPDAWQLSEDRTKLKFIINSSDHPDGFDFTVKGKDATAVFDLKIGNKAQPKRIYIGHDNLHPPTAYFEFPADHR